MALPDVSLARATAESVLPDRCYIDRDPQGVRDNTFNETTGKRESLTGDRTMVYEGPCLIVAAGMGTRRRGTSEGEEASPSWEVRLPHDAAAQVGDRLVLRRVHMGGNSRLLSKRFRIIGAPEESLTVLRRLALAEEGQRE